MGFVLLGLSHCTSFETIPFNLFVVNLRCVMVFFIHNFCKCEGVSPWSPVTPRALNTVNFGVCDSSPPPPVSQTPSWCMLKNFSVMPQHKRKSPENRTLNSQKVEYLEDLNGSYQIHRDTPLVTPPPPMTVWVMGLVWGWSSKGEGWEGKREGKAFNGNLLCVFFVSQN